ncbi:MAG: tyrosine--tRNA ligase [Bacteroidetes bacterium]|nr:tyrosine--tRNA ligase [Bacteroidota bacterium]
MNTPINLIAELQWRGMIQDIMPGTEEWLMKEKVSGYIGFDPTSDSLHIGSLVPILLLVHLQRAGHRPVALVGGATGMVGDPSGKSEERNLLSEEVLQQNVEGVRNQLSKFLDFSASNPQAALLVNNYDWFKGLDFLTFIRDVGKHITVNYMMAKDSVKKRIEGENGMSFTEFSYQLVQGYDFYWLYNNHNCHLQMGGSDQWGNILTGAELIRRKSGGEAYAFTCPLITKADGGKFGKTEKGNVWLDAQKTTPYQFYQFWLNASDEDAEKWIKIFTLLPQDTINQIIITHREKPEARALQQQLALEVTAFVHGKEVLDSILETTRGFFGGDALNFIKSTTAATLEKSGLPTLPYSGEWPVNVVTLLAEAGSFPSKGEAKKMIQAGGVSINEQKITDIQTMIDDSHLLNGRFILVRRGKKQLDLIIRK